MESLFNDHKEYFSFNGNNFIDKLYGSDILRNSLNSKESIYEIIHSWEPFNNKEYLLY